MLVVGVVLLAAFPFAERRAAEPILPLELFRNRVFVVTSAVGFIVGLALFGAITYLPLYLQVVKGHSPTSSGLTLTPMMVGLLFTSILSGQLISRYGRYKPFPIIGTAIMTVAVLMLSRLEVGTPIWQTIVAMVVLGLGLGMVMQVLVLAVQNSVEYSQIGVATSGSTLFRQIGGSIGVAAFGAIFTNRLAGELAARLPPGAHIPTTANPRYRQAPAARGALALRACGCRGAAAGVPDRHRHRVHRLHAHLAAARATASHHNHRKSGGRGCGRRAAAADVRRHTGTARTHAVESPLGPEPVGPAADRGTR